MGCWIDANLPISQRGAGLSDNAGPWILLHVDMLVLSDEELGRAARACADAAWYAEARNRADWICSFIGRKPWDMDRSILRYEELLLQYQKHNDVTLALGEIARLKTYIENKQEKPAKRQHVHRDYNAIFVSIGRRDGFKCKSCGSDEELAIDHIYALANGGTNELDNLQLLCRSCNSSKGAR